MPSARNRFDSDSETTRTAIRLRQRRDSDSDATQTAMRLRLRSAAPLARFWDLAHSQFVVESPRDRCRRFFVARCQLAFDHHLFKVILDRLNPRPGAPLEQLHQV